MYGDPTALRSRAALLEDEVQDLRHAAAALRHRAAATRWVSTTAAEHRAAVERAARTLLASCGGLEHAAELLRRHADVVQRRQAELRAVELLATSWFAATTNWLADGVEALTEMR